MEFLPRRANGKVDWKTLGNILTARILGEVVCASYLDPKYGRREESHVSPDTDWNYRYEDHGVVVLNKSVSASSLCVMGRGVIDLPLNKLSAFIMNPESTFVWDRMLDEIKHLEVLSESENHRDTITCMKIKNRCCLFRGKREYLYYLHSQFLDGKYIQTALSVDCSKFPPTSGIQRGKIFPGSGWVLEPYKDSCSKTLISYIVNVDHSGIPSNIVKRVMRRHPLFIHYIQLHLIDQQQQLQQHEPDPIDSNDTVSAFASLALASTSSANLFSRVTQSGCHYEDPMPLGMFMNNASRMSRKWHSNCFLNSVTESLCAPKSLLCGSSSVTRHCINVGRGECSRGQQPDDGEVEDGSFQDSEAININMSRKDSCEWSTSPVARRQCTVSLSST